MRYTGPRGKAFAGDKGKAQSLQRAADKLVGSVIQRLKAAPFNGKGMLVDRQELLDGSTLFAMVNMIGDKPIIRTRIITSNVQEPESADLFTPQTRTESGYVQWDDLTQELDFGVIYDEEVADEISMQGCEMLGDAYINARPTLTHPQLYALTRERGIELDPQPDSFWTNHLDGDVTSAEACSTAKRNVVLSGDDYPFQFCTGKMRLYQQAKLGHALRATGCCFSDRFVQADSNSGILKDPHGDYWIADIQAYASEPSVDFYRIEMLPEQKTAIQTAIVRGEQQREIEAEVDGFACSTVTALQYSSNIMDGSAIWEYPDFGDSTRSPTYPIAHGWKFSWDTNRAAICLIRNVSCNNLSNWAFLEWHLESQIYEIEFQYVTVMVESVPTEMWVPLISLVESAQFKVKNNWDWWFMLVGRTQTQPWQGGIAPTTGASYADPTNTPIYCYYISTVSPYIRNNTLSIVRVSRTSTTVADVVSHPLGWDYDTNDHTFCPEGAYAYSSSKTYNSYTSFGVTACGEVTEGKTYGHQDYSRVDSVTLNGEWVPDAIAALETPYRPSFSWSYNYETGGWVNTPQMTGCGAVVAGTTTLPPGLTFSQDVDIYLTSGGWTSFRGQLTGYRGDRAVYVAIPLTDAESVIVIKQGVMTKNETRTRIEYYRDTWGARMNSCCGLGITAKIAQIYNNFWSASDPVSIGYTGYKATLTAYGKSGPGHKITKSYDVTNEDTNWPQRNAGGPCILVSPLQYWTSFKQQIDPIWSAGMTFVQGIGAAKKLNTRVTDFSQVGFGTPFYTPSLKEWLRETFVAGGYPKELAEDDHTHPIGFA